VDAPVAAVLDRSATQGIGAGYPLGRDYPEHENGLLVAITERRSRQDIDRLADVLGAAGREAEEMPVDEGVAS
jgi:glycine dehydrogenase subunit 1